MSTTVAYTEAAVGNFVEALGQLSDDRDNRGKRHELGSNNQYLSSCHLSLWERSASQGRVRALVAPTDPVRMTGKDPHPRLRPRPLPPAGEVTDCRTYDTYCLAVP